MNTTEEAIMDEDAVKRIIPKGKSMVDDEHETKRTAIGKTDLIRWRIKDFLHTGITLPDTYWDQARKIVENKKSVSGEDHRRDKEALYRDVMIPLITKYSAMIHFLKRIEESLDKSTFKLINTEITRLWVQMEKKDKKLVALNNKVTLLGNQLMTNKIWQVMKKGATQNALKQAWNQIVNDYDKIDEEMNELCIEEKQEEGDKIEGKEPDKIEQTEFDELQTEIDEGDDKE